MALSDLHRDFLLALKAERDVSELTITAYRSDFSRFLGFLRERRKRDELRYFTSENVRDYQIALSQERKPGTVNRQIASLSSFAGWLVRWNRLPANPCDKIIRPKKRRRLPDYLATSELKALVGLTLSRQEAAIRALLLYAGLRRGEVIALDWRDLNLADGLVRIHGKGRKMRVVPIPDVAKAALQEYALAMGPREAQEAVLLGRQGRRIGRHPINALVRRWGVQIGRPALHPHLLRHTFSTYFLEQGTLAQLQDILGHDSADTTRVYGHSRPQTIRASMAAFSYGIEQESSQEGI